MIDLNKLNGKRRFYYDSGVDEYVKLSDFFDVGVVRGAYINRGGIYGDSATIIITYIDDKKMKTVGVNLPKHQLRNVSLILNDDDTIDVINQLGLSVKPVKYHSKTYKRDCFTLEWVNTPRDLRESIDVNEVNF